MVLYTSDKSYKVGFTHIIKISLINFVLRNIGMLIQDAPNKI